MRVWAFLFSALVLLTQLVSCGDASNVQSTPKLTTSGIAEKATLPASTTPVVYRFAKYSSGAYFYTGSIQEAQIVIDGYPDFRYEGPVFGHDTSDQGIEVYRFANVNNGGYFFTGSKTERDQTIQNYPNMRFEGSTFKSVPQATVGARPVYRLANLNNGAYLYTVSPEEKDYAISLGNWRFEGVTFYAPRDPSVPLPEPIVDSFSCTVPSVGNKIICTALGKNLTEAVQATATNCSPSVMMLNSGQSDVIHSFSCAPSTTGLMSVSINKLADGVLGKSLATSFTGTVLLANSVIVNDWVCNNPSVGFDFLCEFTGYNLPSTISLKSSSCLSGVLTEQAGGTPNFRRFSCPSSASGSFSISYSATPSFSHTLTLRRDRTLGGNSATMSDFVCNYPSANQSFVCEISGANLPNGISITTAGCAAGAMSEEAGGTPTFRRFTCPAITVPSFSVNYVVPNLGTSVAIRYAAYLDWGTANPQIPATAGAATNCGPTFSNSETPPTTTVGDFKLASSGCFVSLKIGQSEWDAMLASDGFGIDTIGYSNRFSKVFKDSFDFVMYVLDTTNIPPNFGYYGLYRSLDTRTPTRIRRQLGNFTLPYLLTSNENAFNGIEGGPILHELLHEWANNGALPGKDASHWGFSSVGGQLGGWDGPAGVQDLGNGLWRARGPRKTCAPSATAAEAAQFCAPSASFGTFANAGNSIEYAPLELMLMGLIPSTSVPDIRIAYDGAFSNFSSGEFTATDWRTVSAASIISNLGNKAPNFATSQKHFRIATVLLTNKDQADAISTNRLNKSLEQFSIDGVQPNGNNNPAYINIHNFYTATRGLAKMRTGQLSQELR